VVIIELLGAPGSGKTTLAGELGSTVDGGVDLEEAVRRAIRDRGEDPQARIAARLSRSPESRLWKAAYARSTDRFSALVRFIHSHPSVLETVLDVQRQRADRDRGQDLVLGWILNLMSRYQLSTEAGHDGPVVIDEGFAQRAVALLGLGFDPDQDPSLLDDYLAAIPRADLVVAVATPIEVCQQRLDGRGWSERVTDLDQAGRDLFLESAVAVVARVASGLAAVGTPLIWVDGTTPPRDSIARVAATFQG
jgi:broad-specificity NMP kinase